MQDPWTLICSNCGEPLLIHGRTTRGQFCDLELAMKNLWRVLREEWRATKARWHY